jgi:membrane fusion protein (multidrug efflux system)
MNSHNNNSQASSPKHGKILFILWKNLPRLILFFLILIIIFLMIIVKDEKIRLEKEKAASQPQSRKAVNTILLDLKPQTIQDALNLPGIIEPWIRLELMAKVNGTISEVLVREGSVMQRGDIIARIESDDYRIALDSAKASYKLAKSKFERAMKMVRNKTIPIADLEMSETQMYTAKSAMEDAELKLSRCTITSPMSGVIRRLDAKIGLFLNIGDPVAKILQIDRVKAVVGIPESDVRAAKKISSVEITIQALDDRRLEGTKYFLAPSPESAARLYRLELELDNPGGDILPGMFLRAHVVKDIVHDAITVPLYSVITRGDEQFVFVVHDGVVHKQKVKLGIVEGWQVQTTEGLQADDQVVIEGHRDVEDGQAVNVIKVITDPENLINAYSR